MRIALVGSHGCGKTTLLKAINTPLRKITEVSRKLQNEMGFNPLVGDSTYEDKLNFEKAILKEQIKQELGGNFLSDRSVFDVLAYASSLLDPLDYVDLAENANWHYVSLTYDHIFFIPIEFPMESDGVRPEDEEYRKEIEERMKRILKQFGVEYHELRGTVEERVAKYNRIVNGE